MNKLINCLAIVMIFNLASMLSAHESVASSSVRQLHFEIKPYLQNASTDSIYIMWELSEKSECKVHWGKEQDVASPAVPGKILNNGRPLYQTKLTKLEPGTRYFYQVRAKNLVSNLYSFITPKVHQDEAPLRILATSDIQSGAKVFKDKVFPKGIMPWVNKNHQGDLPTAFDFMMLPGDLVDDGRKYNEWIDFFDATHPLLSYVPMYAILGNHEKQSKNYYDLMNLPENGDAKELERWWFKDYSNIRLIGLDSNDWGQTLMKKQLTWLDGLLIEVKETESIDFVLVELHHPHVSELWPEGNSDFTGVVMDKLAAFTKETGKHTCIFFGHTHGYARGHDKNHGHVKMNVAGGGGNLGRWGSSTQVNYDDYSISEYEHGFAVINVTAGDNPSVNLAWHGQDGEGFSLKDQIMLRKNNRAPLTPQTIKSDGRELAVEDLCLKLSPYQDPDMDELSESHWQISTDKHFKDIVYDKWRKNKDVYRNIDLRKDIDLSQEFVDHVHLQPAIEYYWRARYRDASLAWSDWSTAEAFSVLGTKMINVLSKKKRVITLSDKKIRYEELVELIDLRQYKGQVTGLYYGARLKSTDRMARAAFHLDFLDKDKKVISKSLPLEKHGKDWQLKSERALIPAQTRYVKAVFSAGGYLIGTEFEDVYLMLDIK